MTDYYSHPPADAEVAFIVDQLSNGLQNIEQTLMDCRTQLEQGYSMGELRGITPEEYAALYKITRDLCDKGDFHHALPVALQMALHNPMEHRYPFIAGACLQRLGHTEQAVLMYALACDVKPDDAASAYRLGECLMTAQRPHEAKQFLQNAIELSYGKFHCRKLQELAIRKLKTCTD